MTIIEFSVAMCDVLTMFVYIIEANVDNPSFGCALSELIELLRILLSCC
mgnify:CR=1 FL=1